jgi:hypothetical protein
MPDRAIHRGPKRSSPTKKKPPAPPRAVSNRDATEHHTPPDHFERSSDRDFGNADRDDRRRLGIH